MPEILVIAGDGVGPEVTREAVETLKVADKIHKIGFHFGEALAGGVAIDATGRPLPDETLEKARKADAVLLGAVGGPKWDDVPHDRRPERALLGLREKLGLYANLRPARIFESLLKSSPLKPEVARGADLLIVRELTGGIYFGKPKGIEILGDGSERGVNSMVYTTGEIERIARKAFDLARRRRKLVHSVDKANVLEVMELWRRTVIAVSKDYPDVTLRHMYVDNCSMQLIRDPRQFDVIVTGNLFGDILSDEAAMITGSIGMLPSASLGERGGLYEPVHGSAPDIAGQDKANPLAAILSAAMMLRFTFGRENAAALIEAAVDRVLDSGARTADIARAGDEVIGTHAMGERVRSAMKV